ncbi:hypothetical protein E2C01_007682 [Portunus trituberculatus]|uniref:Uncharacterized protein n=1 Tax=Portunus trituberculatus TaxID=210409 RepID=A0A5B7D1U4_PORTR|nr:hypothetical protein [Portunus trituberculatus]
MKYPECHHHLEFTSSYCEGSGSLLAVVRILAYLEGAWRALQKAARGGAGGGSVSEERVEIPVTWYASITLMTWKGQHIE